ncbi:restriction endonuclease subunit S [Proteus faecis]|uniref:restriction endonuclease subunit S n=1 Tax=Proteus faecis TaxID=2050967 RepID=UPI003075D1A0
MSADKKVPDIRFKGFSGEWEKNYLGNLIEIRSAARVHKEQWTEVGVPFFRTSDVISIYKGQENNKAYISHTVYQGLSEKIGKVTKNDLLITGGGSIGIPYLVPNNEPLYFKDADLLWLKNNKKFDGYFLYSFFFSEPFKKYIKSISHTGTIAHYTIEQAKTTPINTCSNKEQTQIGNYFQKLDNLINQHQQKHDKLSNIKKSMLEKMFPKQGETVPEIRFKGFSEVWEQSNLARCTDLLTGNPFNSKEFTAEGIFLVRGMNVKRGYLDTSKEISAYWPSFKGLESYLLKPEDIVIQMDGALIGKSYAKIKSSNLPAILVQRVTRVRCSEVNSEFIYQYIQKNFLNYIWGIKTETAVPHLSLHDIKNFSIFLPTKKEQTAIGNYFQKLDTLIEQHQQQITKLNNIKQACLSKMFI